MENKIAHRFDAFGARCEPHRWREPKSPDTPFETCSYCGSMAPAALAAAITAGASVSWSDFKYGWPHKIYVDKIPNAFAGAARVTMWTSRDVDKPMSEAEMAKYGYNGVEHHTEIRQRWVDGFMTENSKKEQLRYKRTEPAGESAHGKFYTVHLQDGTPAEREIIQKAMGIDFTFSENGTVKWDRNGAPPHIIHGDDTE